MPLQLLGTIASSQYIPSNVYLLNITGSSPSDFLVGSGAKSNSSGDIYVAGYDNNVPTANILKYNNNGVIQWQKNYTSGTPIYGLNIIVDSAGNPYLISRSDSPPGGAISGMHMAKFNPSGTLQWQRILYKSASSYAAQGVGIDSSDNIYLGGYDNASSPAKGELAKYNSSGTLQWQRELTFSTGVILYSAAVDSSGNVYSSGELGANSLIVKYNTSGTLQYQREISGSGAFTYKSAATTSNQYTNGWMVIGGVYYGLVCKFDSSGGTVWARTIGDGNNCFGYDVVLDSSENVYTASSIPSAILLAKYNSSGTLQWQRRISVNTGAVNVSARGLFISGDNIYVSGWAVNFANAQFFTAVLPTDGSKTGTYSLGGYNYTYAASSLTSATTSITNVAASATSSTATFTDAAASNTVGNTTFTASTVIL